MSFFKRSSTHYGKSPEPETPYQRAAQVWDERIGSARVQARNWRLMAFGSLILSGGFAAALVQAQDQPSRLDIDLEPDPHTGAVRGPECHCLAIVVGHC